MNAELAAPAQTVQTIAPGPNVVPTAPEPPVQRNATTPNAGLVARALTARLGVLGFGVAPSAPGLSVQLAALA
jgi:hypothetical protein